MVQGYIATCLCLFAICYMLYATCFAYMLYAHGEKVDMHEKQPNGITEKLEYLENNEVNE